MLSSYCGLNTVRNGEFLKFTRNVEETDSLSVLTDGIVYFVCSGDRERASFNEIFYINVDVSSRRFDFKEPL